MYQKLRGIEAMTTGLGYGQGEVMRWLKIVFTLTGIMFLGACASLPSVATNVEFCCAPEAAEVSDYRVEFVEMPEFLKPMLRDEASIILRTKGLEYTEVEGEGDALLTMTFVNRTLEGIDENRDEAWETIAPGGGVRFIAEVRLEMKSVAGGVTLMSGTMGRVHNVYEGSYMHDAPGRSAMRDAFLTLFADFPPRASE